MRGLALALGFVLLAAPSYAQQPGQYCAALWEDPGRATFQQIEKSCEPGQPIYVMFNVTNIRLYLPAAICDLRTHPQRS